MKTIKLAMLSVALLALVTATSFAQVARGAGGAGGGGGGRGGGGGFTVMGVAGGNSTLGVLFVGTSVATDEALMAQAATIATKYAADIRAGRATRAGPPADSLVAKATIATAKRNEELKGLLKNDADKKKFDENVKASLAPRGGGR